MEANLPFEKLYINCGGCKHFRRATGDCTEMYTLFPKGKIPEPVSGITKKNEVPDCWEPQV